MFQFSYSLFLAFLSVLGEVDVIVLVGHIVQMTLFASVYDAWVFVEHGYVVGRHDDSRTLLGDVFEYAYDMACCLGVEVACRFISDDELRVVE